MAKVQQGFRQPYARVLERVFTGNSEQLRIAWSLLAGPEAQAEDVELDSQVARTQQFVGAVDKALRRLDPKGSFALQVAAESCNIVVPKALPGGEMLVDLVGRWLLESLRVWPVEAAGLAVATGRLIEESDRLNPLRRREKPLGVGFDQALDERLRLRFELIETEGGLFAALGHQEVFLLEAPAVGLQSIENEIGRKLSVKEREWLRAERFARMVEWSRSNLRKYWQGQIRWFLRDDPASGPVLDRYGARGHWLVVGNPEATVLARAGVLAARATNEEREQSTKAWRALVLDNHLAAAPSAGATPATAPIDEAYALPGDPTDAGEFSIEGVKARLTATDPDDARRGVALALSTATPARSYPRRYELTTDSGELRLVSVGGPANRRPLAQVALDPDDDALLDFQGVLRRTAEGARIIDRVGAVYAEATAVRWARALLAQPAPGSAGRAADDLTDLKVRLVYVPASRPHPLGGLPTIGLWYLADRLEQLGARAEVMTLAEDFRRRRVELLGADVIGFSTYLTNYRKVARNVEMLRESGFTGKIVLGGPHLREIDLIQKEVQGWDALIRGEGEEAFPQVVRALRRLDAGEADRALDLARSLRGVAISHGDLVVLADTAARNTAKEIACPLPFEWQRHNEPGVLKMNFTRGCPYECGFCPNHQGRKFHSCGPNEMWSFTERAAADALILPRAEEERIAVAIQAELGVDASPRLRPALDLLLRNPVRHDLLEEICGSGSEPTAGDRVPRWQAKQRWLASKAAALPQARLRHPDDTDRDPDRPELQRFEIMTSEDNTLVNRGDVMEYLKLRRLGGLADAVVFNPGQNTVRDLTDHHGTTDVDYIDALCEQNPFKVVLGIDGTSNPVLRQNQKPYYGIGEAVALNRALTKRGVEILNNYILINPETNLLEAIESFALFVMLPIRWRDHGPSINLRITKEAGTRSHDEGVLFAPRNRDFNDPLRFREVNALLRRWKLTAQVHSADLPKLLWRMLAEDRDAQRLLPKVIRRWECDFDRDPFLKGLARRVAAAQAPGKPLVVALREVADAYREAWPDEPSGSTDTTLVLEDNRDALLDREIHRRRRSPRRDPSAIPPSAATAQKGSDSVAKASERSG